ncbi:hypothetical protein BJ742DRAFT_174806 [Cladochytrium replicatum]|nr:hypothetical protein BJ742DRAFT_174806 [Cladochytrium replicatum]
MLADQPGGDNFHLNSLPHFANEENKRLGFLIKEKELELSSISAVLDDNQARAESMRAHMKNVQQELLHTQALYEAKSRQIETEDHLKLVAERESGRLAAEIKRMEKEITEIMDHLNLIQNNIYRGSEQIESVRTELKLEKNELEEWLRVQSEKEEDSVVLTKYTKEDEARIKEFSLQIEKLMHEVNKKRSTLSMEVTETQVTQIELEKAAVAFKQLHQDRLDLIAQWDHAIKTMQRRDREIDAAEEKCFQLKEEIRQKQAIIDEKQAHLDQQIASNSEMEKSIGISDRLVSKNRLEHTSAQSELSQFQDEVEVLRNTLNKTSADLLDKRNSILNLKADLAEKQSRLEKEKQRKADMKQKLMDVASDTMTLEAKSQQLQEILKEEEFRNKELDRELKLMREQHFKKSQELFKLKQEEKNLIAETVGGEAAIRNLKSKIHKCAIRLDRFHRESKQK